MVNNQRAQYATSIGSVIALILLVAIGAIIVSQVTGVMAPSENEDVSHPVEENIRQAVERGGTTFSLLSIVVIVGGAVLVIVFVTSSMAAFGGEFEGRS